MNIKNLIKKWALIFDLDNTLCRCSEYYSNAKNAFAEAAHQRTGIDKKVALEILDGIDHPCTRLYGVNRKRFPTSFAAASVAIDMVMSYPMSFEASERSRATAEAVFSAEYPLYNGVFDALQLLKREDHPMFLCTMGDYEVQLTKIINNNLHLIFPANHIYIGEKKDAESFQNIINDFKLNVEETVIIGDSIGVDICPAVEVGAIPIQVINGDEVTMHDVEECAPHKIIRSVTELPKILEQLS
jgi:FMN phosphatase YigB (HAD superfamily)